MFEEKLASNYFRHLQIHSYFLLQIEKIIYLFILSCGANEKLINEF